VQSFKPKSGTVCSGIVGTHNPKSLALIKPKYPTTEIAIKAHEEAFEFYGGIPEEIVYDQDRLFIVDENKGDFILADAFKSYVRERSFSLYFCRKADPESKGKIENVVKYVKQNFLYNRSFYDVDTLNADAIGWLNRTANFLPHGRTKLPPFEQWHIERKHLKPFFPMNTQIPSNKLYKVHPDNVVSYKSCLYTVPQGTYKRPKVEVTITEENGMLIIKNQDGQEICRHKKSAEKGKTIRNTDHKRDKTLKITALLKQESEYFSDPVKALNFFEELRNRKRRHIRDQAHIIRQLHQQYETFILDKTLDYCLKNGVYSAVDFMSVAEKLYQENGKPEKSDQQVPEIKTLQKNDLKYLQPKTSQIIDYESLMPN